MNGVLATITNGAWTATVPVDEGPQLLTVVAADTLGHLTTLARSVLIDRTAPAIEVRESGAPFTATLLNRSVTLLVRAIDADPNVQVTTTLDGSAYLSGAAINTEGAHTLAVTATDCAGHSATRSFPFTIDRTPPAIRNLNPANGATVGTMPASIAGSTDPDAATIELLGTPLTVAPAPDATFVLSGVGFAEGVNRFILRATDHAGNSAQYDYTVTVKTAPPVVTILEGGTPLVSGTLYTRAVTPEIKVDDATATLSATLNGAPFTSGTTITADGDYRLTASATDSLGHTGTAERVFTIDRTAPSVQITFPQSGSVSATQVEVRGVATNAVTADVNGNPVLLDANGNFVLPTLHLEFGTTRIVATAYDRAGNSGIDEIEVTRDDVRPGIILTYPPDRSLTNRPTTEVLGRVLSTSPTGVVTIGTQTTPVDPLGAFRLSGYPLVEGDNTITASTATGSTTVNSASVVVTADFTPPALTILESDQPLNDGARFATEAVLSLQASDNRGSVTSELTVDGTKVPSMPHTVTATGGHVAVAIARDEAGNETRVERTFFIGATGGGAVSCALTDFDPADGAVVLSASTTLLGRTTSEGVKVNDVPASVADGSFRATVELPLEGANVVTLRCTDATGVAFGDPVTITLNRVTGDPSIEITSPNEGFVTAAESITVSGTVGPGVITTDVNGATAVIAGTDASVTRPFTVAGVRLASGLNVLVARGRNAAGRVATASRRVYALRNEPAIIISSPVSGTTTGTPRIDVAGTFTHLDPATIVVTNVASGTTTSAQTTRLSDTTGTYTATDVPLVSGEQTLRVSGRDQANREATATVTVRLTAGAPSISIASPANNAFFGPTGGDAFTVSGTFAAAPGSTVDVAGTAATIDGATFTASAPFSTIGNMTTVIARVTEPTGLSAIDTVVVTKLAAAPRVIESFPAPNAVEVDAGALLLVLFSAPMDRDSLADGAFRLEDAGGATVSGTLFLDKDVLTFAPAALLARGARYTLRVGTGAKDVAGTSLENEWVAPFTVGTSAPSTPPTLTPVSEAFCGQTVMIRGTAPAGARLQLAAGSLALTTLADGQGDFTFNFPLSGQSGYAVVRVRIVGSDGSLSPAAELSFRVDCIGPQVLNATYDRGGTNRLTIDFSESIDPASATTGPGAALYLTLSDGSNIGGNATVTGSSVALVPSEDLSARSFTLNVGTAILDTIGNRLVVPYTQTFTIGGEQPPAGDGSGFISGEIYDATTGRPLPGATVTVEIPNAAFSTNTDARGRYLVRLPEGAHTIRAWMNGYTSVWRQIVVPSGAGVVPIDIRLTRRNDTKTHGGETPLTRPVELTTSSAASVTAVGAQALTGLLPLGWSPLASAEVVAEGALAGAHLTFTVPAADITAATQNLAAVRYDEARDEWNVLESVVNITDGKVTLPISTAGAYALVYADKAPGLTVPPLAQTGAVLAGVPAPEEQAPLVSTAFTLDPPIVLPNGRTVAALQIEGAGAATFPSGTAVQAYIDEELHLADGSRLLDPPFATDLLLYRSLAGNIGNADFHLAPSPRAAQVILEVGFDHIRVVPYPGRLDRGTLVGSEGGRIPGDDRIAVDIPAGAAPEPLRATALSLTQQDLDAVGTIQGFQIVGGFTLTLQRATQPVPQDVDGDGQPDVDPTPVQLFKPARATFTLSTQHAALSTQFVLVELLDQTPYGKMVRLAAQIERPSSARATTTTIDRSVLPLDGIAHEGRYLLLAADAPIAFATGIVRLGGRLLADARVTASSLGVADLTRTDGIYNIPVLAAPAAPFTLTPRHTETGDGAAYTHASAPAPDAIVRVDLALVPQPPRLVSVTVFAGQPPALVTLGAEAGDVSPSTGVRATFTPAIDPASVTDDAIKVVDASTGIAVAGKATADGTLAVNWALTPGTTLESGHRYIVLVSPRIRAPNGAELGNVTTYGFTTSEVVLNTEVRAELVSITIPDANGVSRVTGAAGALPANWQALVVRRQRDFITRYQATAAADGSFTFLVGNGGDRADRVTMSDLIDLRVVNNAGNLAAIIPLTPFVTEDRRGFVVPAGAAARFVTADGVTIDVAEGTFEEATMVTANVVAKELFNDVPSFDHDVNFAASVRLDFEGRATKPIEIEIPVPAGVETANRNFLLALKGQSIRGPRLFAVDTIRVADGKFTTTLDPSEASRRIAVTGASIGTNQTLTGDDLKNYLMRVERSGVYMVHDIRVPVGGAVGWAVMEGLQHAYDLFWSILASYYAPHYYVVERARIIVPVIQGLPFTVVGVDATTGIQAFSKVYDPIPIGDPNVATVLPPPQNNTSGPYPVFGTPFRVETIDLNASYVDIRSVRNFVLRLANDQVTVKAADNDPLPSETKVEVLNVSNGTRAIGTAGQTISLAARRGNRIVLLVEQREVDPNSRISLVFNEPIYIDGTDPDAIDDFLRERFRLEKAPLPPAGSTAPPAFADISPMVRYSADSGGRRITLDIRSSLQREMIYRLVLMKNIADRGGANGSAGLTLGQGANIVNGDAQPIGGGNDLNLEFRVRKPGGLLGNFELQDGAIRDLALNGNVLLVAATSGGLVAYDVADPAALNGVPAPIAIAPAGASDFWSLASDHHGRIYTTSLGAVSGQLRSYRLEDFLDGGTCCNVKGGTLLNWRVGYSSSLGLFSNTLLSDRPESFPHKIRLVVQDEIQTYENRAAFEAVAAVVQLHPGDIKQMSATFSFDGSSQYLVQRVTVENVTLDMRWSADATPGGSAVIQNIIAGPYDRIRVLRNRTTYGVVSHLGYGIGVYDLNALESNRSPHKPSGYINLAEQVVLSRGINEKACFSGGQLPPDWVIQEIWLNADNTVRTEGSSPHLYVYAPDPYRGLLDMKFKLPTEDEPVLQNNTGPQCGTRSPTGMVFRAVDPQFDHPTIAALKAAYSAAGGGQAYPHFHSVASYAWRLEAENNKRGERWSEPNQPVQREYVLAAAGDLGLLVVEVNGNPPPTADGEPVGYYPLENGHLADIIWVPSGALAVRTIPRTNFAVVVSRYGRVHLVDLSRIDERFDDNGQYIGVGTLFPTAKKALASPPTYANAVGAEDPRIVWTSEPGVARGGLPPVIDPETGMLYSGHLIGKVLKAVAAIDPRVVMKVDIGQQGGLSEVGGVVPLGIDPPQDILDQINALPPCAPDVAACKENASLGTFRLEVTLPGAVAEKLTQSNNQLLIAVESERVHNAPTEQTPPGFPRSHLRRFRRDGTPEPANRAATHFRMRRIVPEALENVLRHQKGFNKFVSPWVVAIADPRASSRYVWPDGDSDEARAEAGCNSCRLPRHLENVPETEGVYELWTNGRHLAVRPELGSTGTNIFAGTPYAYLGEQNRLVTRFATVPADTVRAIDVRVPGQNPAVAEGAVQDTIYLHSGEYEVDALDIKADGRAGFDVVFDRTYRSRTIGGTVLGQGWESSNFRRVRALPNGDVELRDPRGEVWLFKTKPNSAEYESPKGYFQKMFRSDHGWVLLDQQWRATGFDDLGRLSYETDEFANQAALAAGTSDGNVIRYLYDASGRLAQIVDPVERASTLTYWTDAEAATPGAYPGLLKEVKDWRDRTTLYEYDNFGRLVKVKGAEAPAAEGVPSQYSFVGDNRPLTEYTYQDVSLPPIAPTPSQGFNDYIEFVGNLASITDPDQSASSGSARVELTHGEGTSHERDRLQRQDWATGENVTVDHSSPTSVATQDALGQRRAYTLTDKDLYDQRVHIANATVEGVATIHFDSTPASANVSESHASTDLVTKFSYNDEGLHTEVRHANDLIVTNNWGYPKDPSSEGDRASSIAPGMVLESSTSSGPGLPEVKTDIKYDTQHDNAKATPVAVSRGDDEREAEVPSAERLTVQQTEDGYTVETEFNKAGQPIAQRNKDASGTVTQETKTVYHEPTDTSLLVRSRPARTHSADLSTTFSYAALDKGGEKVTVTDEITQVKTESHFDPYGRKTRETVTANGLTLQDESFGYDPAGRLAYHSRVQKGVGDVVTTFKYDAMGRQVESTLSGAAVDGGTTTLTLTTHHDLLSRTVTETGPSAGGGGSQTVRRIDGLGRPRITERVGSGGEILRSITGFDRGGSPSYTSDGARMAIAQTNDALGRELGSVGVDGVGTETTWNEWNEPETITQKAGGTVIAVTKNTYTDKGRLSATAASVGGRARVTAFAVEAGGTKRTTRMGEAGSVDATSPTGDVRVQEEIFDSAGRKIRQTFGSGSAAFSETTYTYKGFNPETITLEEPLAGASSTTTVVADGLGRVIQTQVDGGNDSTITEYDEAGNTLSLKTPGMAATVSKYDSRGLVTEMQHPDGSSTTYTYDSLGVLRSYGDEGGNTTFMTTDGLGRVVRTDYPDGTSEETRYEAGTGVVTATRDRAGQWLGFSYSTGGRVAAVHDGMGTGGPTLIEYFYDDAGRLREVRNADAGIVYEGYDALGRPSLTRTTRYAAGSGISGSPVVLDVHTQSHTWSVFDGERTSWSMPANGSQPGVDIPVSLWLQTIQEQRDAGSNLTIQSRGGGGLLTVGSGRADSKLASRERAAAGSALATTYGYADGSAPGVPAPPSLGAKTFALRYAQSTLDGVTIGGSANGRDAAERITQTIDLGANHSSEFGYDARGHLAVSRLNIGATAPPRPPIVDSVTPAGFRWKRTIAPILGPTEHAALGEAAAEAEPLTWTSGENSAHQATTRTSTLDGSVVATNDYTFAGGRRTSDGRWQATFDQFGRLVAVTHDVSGRRIEYAWDPNDRIVGRSAYRFANDAWILEDRAAVLSDDGLPAETTFVWDPVEDRLLAIYAAGASTAPDATQESGLVYQYLHGDQGYDDPIRVIVADASGQVRSYLPILDEAGTGSLQAVVDATTGNIVERVLYADAFGDRPRYLHGAVVDSMQVETKKSLYGELEKLTIRVHLSEAVVGATLADGVRLASVDGSGNVVMESAAVPVLEDPSTILWELGPIQWELLAAEGTALEIAITDSLRTDGWGDASVSHAPQWARDLYGVVSKPETPFVARQSFAQVEADLEQLSDGGTSSTTLYSMPDLYLAADRESKTKLLTGFKASPFIEPATTLAYFRARWYDAATGSWLTPDPRGYSAGSSNLYAGFANDPVNHIDPEGEEPITATVVLAYLGWTALNTAIDVGIDYGIHLWRGEGDFELGRSVTTNFAVNLATGGIGGKVAKLRHLRHLGPFARKGISEGVEYLADVAVTGTMDVVYGESVLDAYGGAAFGGLLGRGTGAALRKAAGFAGKRLGGAIQMPGRGITCRCLSPDTDVSTPDGTREIAELRVGDRVLTANDDSRDTSVDPTWKLIKLRMPVLDGSSDVLLVEMLRPAAWVERDRAAAGYWIDLRIPELSLAGRAEVLSVEEAPPIQPAPGRVVLATFEHSDTLLEIRLGGNTEPLRTTPWHWLYSADRNAFVRAGDLRAGERLRTRDADVVIESLASLGDRRRVRDIEVEFDHVYFAGDAGVLSHNATGCAPTKWNLGVGAHPEADEVGKYIASAVRVAKKQLDRGGTGNTAWGRIYHSSWIQGSAWSWFRPIARGNAIQQMADAHMERLAKRGPTPMTRYGVISNQGFRIDRKLWSVLRPDYQFLMSNGKWAVFDITTAKSASKMTKYKHAEVGYMRNLFYR